MPDARGQRLAPIQSFRGRTQAWISAPDPFALGPRNVGAGVAVELVRSIPGGAHILEGGRFRALPLWAEGRFGLEENNQGQTRGDKKSTGKGISKAIGKATRDLAAGRCQPRGGDIHLATAAGKGGRSYKSTAVFGWLCGGN